MDNIERYLKENRDELYDKEPPAHVWPVLREQLFSEDKTIVKKQAPTLRIWLGIAASLVILTVAGVWFMVYRSNAQAYMATLNPAIEQQDNYSLLIQSRRDELEIIKTENPKLYHTCITDLDKLRSDYLILKNGLAKSPNKEETLDAMMKNLEAQMDALNQQMNIIRQLKQLKGKKHEHSI